MNNSKTVFFIEFIAILLSACQSGSNKLVKNITEFNQAVSNIQPGETITLHNGIWSDVELLFEGVGTEEAPITLEAEENGKVIIEGESNLRLAGDYLIVKGLVFKDGNTPSIEVISFCKDDGVYANNSRLTECVVDNYNPSERMETSTYVGLYGKNNRVDHCTFARKRTYGVTLIVRLIDTLCQNNNHLIDSNYFAPRQNLGSNGGETMRIGTSHFSRTTSGTRVVNNYFESCDGEHEIVSNKSCGNSFINNTFYECRGTLTYRHGNNNVSEGNFFFGNGKEHTGGIRIINKRNKAINNYFYGLKGYRFRGALVIMNGVPNSPINRYDQVVGGEFSHNTFVNCDHIQLCAGSDAERSAVPIDSKVDKNIFYHDSADKIISVYDDISGIEFTNNFISESLKSIDKAGIKKINIELIKNEAGVYMPTNLELKEVGCSLTEPSATLANTGAEWYVVPLQDLVFDRGKEILVKPGLNTLFEAVKSSASGDIIVLKESGEYKVNKNIKVNHPLTVKSSGEGRPIVKAGKSSLFFIENGGSLKLEGLEFDGRYSPDKIGNSIVSTSRYSMNQNYKLYVDNCIARNLDVNHSFNFLKSYKNTFADSIVITNSVFENVTGNILALNKEDDRLGIYNAEYIILKNNIFKDIQGTALIVLRGGSDESTFGPSLTIDHCVFENIGNGKRNYSGAALYIHGVQICNISNSIFTNSKSLELFLTNGKPITNIANCNFYNSDGITSNNDSFYKLNITGFNPLFIDDGFVLSNDSKLKGTGTDGENLGLIEN